MARMVLKTVDLPRCCARLPQECQTTDLLTVEQRGDRKGTMPHRHYGVPIAKRRPTYSGPTRAAAWSGSAIVGGIIAIVIVLGFVVYEVSKIVAHASNAATSAPRATGEGSRAL
jgi:hypothetical protein